MQQVHETSIAKSMVKSDVTVAFDTRYPVKKGLMSSCTDTGLKGQEVSSLAISHLVLVVGSKLQIQQVYQVLLDPVLIRLHLIFNEI